VGRAERRPVGGGRAGGSRGGGGRAVRFGAGRERGRGAGRLAGVVGDVLAQQRADEEDLLGLDLNVRRLQ